MQATILTTLHHSDHSSSTHQLPIAEGFPTPLGSPNWSGRHQERCIGSGPSVKEPREAADAGMTPGATAAPPPPAAATAAAAAASEAAAVVTDAVIASPDSRFKSERHRDCLYLSFMALGGAVSAGTGTTTTWEHSSSNSSSSSSLRSTLGSGRTMIGGGMRPAKISKYIWYINKIRPCAVSLNSPLLLLLVRTTRCDCE